MIIELDRIIINEEKPGQNKNKKKKATKANKNNEN